MIGEDEINEIIARELGSGEMIVNPFPPQSLSSEETGDSPSDLDL